MRAEISTNIAAFGKPRTYVHSAAALSLVFLLFALASKAYHGPMWRLADAYLGDTFIVACLYFFLTVLRPLWSWRLKILIIGGIAVAVEAFQASGIQRAWGLPKPFVFIFGTSFDPLDFACYALGLWWAYLSDRFLLKKLTR